MLTPLVPVGRTARIALGIAFFVLFFLAWGAATLGGFVNRTFLADPITMVASGWRLLVVHGFYVDIGVTVWRVVGGFVLAAAVGVPLGMAMGAYKPVEAFFEPFVSFARYLPASAFIPLLILWAGIGETPKLPLILSAGRGEPQPLLVVFIGSSSQIVLMVAVSVASPRRDLVEAAYTLGARASGIVRRVLLPSSAPDIAESLRLVLGWAWTYVIVAELIGASSGIGHMITDSQALLDTGQIIFGIVVIGVVGLVSDYSFRRRTPRLCPWGRACAPAGAPPGQRGAGPPLPGDARGPAHPCHRAALAPRRRQRLPLPPRALGLRQVHAPPHDRRTRPAD